MHVRKTGVLFALLVGLAAVSASATTINFASLQGNSADGSLPGALMAGNSFTQQGFAIASVGGPFDVWQFGNAKFPGTSPAATSLFEFYAGSETLITYNGSQPFTLDSVDFAPLLSGGSGPFTFLVTGVYPDQSFITQMVTVNNFPFGLQTVTFSGFTNVTAVNFLQGTNAGYFQGQETAYQFNNIVVTSTTSAIPEPRTLLMLGSGVLGLAGVARRKLKL